MAVMIASLLCAKAGLTVTPLVVVAVVVAYLTSEALSAYVDAPREPDHASPAAAAHPAASSS